LALKITFAFSVYPLAFPAMSVSQRTAQNIRERLLKKSDPEGLRKRLSPRLPDSEPLADRLPLCNDHTAAGL
jgi:hypothetical protein